MACGICRGLFTRGALFWGIFTPDERNITITGESTGRGIVCAALPEGPGFAEAVEGGWINLWVFAGGTWIWFSDGLAFAEAVEGAWFGPWGLGGGVWISFPDRPAFADAVEGGLFGP